MVDHSQHVAQNNNGSTKVNVMHVPHLWQYSHWSDGTESEVQENHPMVGFGDGDVRGMLRMDLMSCCKVSEMSGPNIGRTWLPSGVSVTVTDGRWRGSPDSILLLARLGLRYVAAVRHYHH